MTKPVSKIDRYVIDKIKEKRIELGYSQADLSYKLDVSATFIGQVESNGSKSRYSLERIEEIAGIFNCHITDFFPIPSS